MKHVFFVFTLACAMIFLMVGGCGTNPATGKRELVLMSKDDEIELGNQVAPHTLARLGGRYDDDEVQRYAGKMGAKVVDTCDRKMPYEFIITNAPWPNACAIFGGRIYVNAGMLVFLENEQQFVAILGHEVAHVCARHAAKKIQLGKATSTVFGYVSDAVKGRAKVPVNKALALSDELLNKAYSRAEEYEADAIGVRYIQHAGYNPWAQVSAFDLMLKLDKADRTTFDELFLTHPPTTKRIQACRVILNRDYPSADPGAQAGDNAEFNRIRAKVQAEIAKKSKAQIQAEKEQYCKRIGRKSRGPAWRQEGPGADQAGGVKASARYAKILNDFWDKLAPGADEEALQLCTAGFREGIADEDLTNLRQCFRQFQSAKLEAFHSVAPRKGVVHAFVVLSLPSGEKALLTVEFDDQLINHLEWRASK